MTDKMNDNIKVPVEELQPFIDKAKLIVMELENHLNSFMVEPEKNTVVKWFPDSPMDTAGLKLCLSF